jgi:hypothetical protein
VLGSIAITFGTDDRGLDCRGFELRRGGPPAGGQIRVLPASPSCHIHNSLTITLAFRRLLAFDRVWQHLVKVDGTFA